MTRSPSKWAPSSDRRRESRLLSATWACRETARPSPAAQSGRIGAWRREGTQRRLPFPNLSLRPPQAPGRLRGAAARLVTEVPSAVLGSLRNGGMAVARSRRGSSPRHSVGRLRPRPSSRCTRLFASGLRKTNRCISKSQQHRRPGCMSRISSRSPGAVVQLPPSSRPFRRPLSRAMPSRRIGARPAAFGVALD